MTPAEPSEDNPGLRAPAKIAGLLWSALALLIILSFWQTPHYLNLISSFRVQLLCLFTLLSIPSLLAFSGKTRLLFLAVPMAFWLTLLGYIIPFSYQPEASEGRLNVAMANVYTQNRDLTRLKAWLEKNPSDIVAVLEVGPHHRSQLEALPYPYQLIEARTNNFGIALLSKHEPESITLVDEEGPFPSIVADFGSYQVLATHPVPPLSPEARQVGDDQVFRLCQGLQDKPAVVLGDMNATAWDYRAAPFKEMGLKDSRRGHGLIPTWPVGRPWMYIPIDHIFIPEDWGAESFERGPDIGSDHFPVRAQLFSKDLPSAKEEAPH